MGQEPVRPGGDVSEEHLGIWSFDIASGLSFLDPAISRLFGIDAEVGARGVGCERVLARIHPDDRSAALRETERVLRYNDLFSWFYQLQAADGSYETLHATGRCFQDVDGRPTHIAGILRRVVLAEGTPVEIEMLEGLARLRDLARLTRDPMLPRLIEAVMLHAGRELAKGINVPRPPDGPASGDAPEAPSRDRPG